MTVIEIDYENTNWEMNMSNKTKILILGGGFGGGGRGASTRQTLARRADVEVTLVSCDNFLPFTPMLHEVASGDLNPSDIVNPIRRIPSGCSFSKPTCARLTWLRSGCTAPATCAPPLDLDYDHLVLAFGLGDQLFRDAGRGRERRDDEDPGDAALLRARVLEILEAASLEPDAAVRKRMLTFVVAGGGFAGVETIGAINDLVREALRYYPSARATRGACHPHPPRRGCAARTWRKARPLHAAEAGRPGCGDSPEGEGEGYVNSLVAVSRGEGVPRGHAHLDRGGDVQPRGRVAAVQEGEGAG